MSDLVGNPEDRFSHNKAQIILEKVQNYDFVRHGINESLRHGMYETLRHGIYETLFFKQTLC